ncbi:MAG: MFS transporter [Nitrospirae bacterium]|nr:MFS transporter [Nitrospirota bacterium]
MLSVPRNVFYTGLVSFFMDLSSEMIYPLVPLFLSSVIGVNRTVIGLIEGIAESTASILKVYSGWLSDRIGKRKILLIAGYGISTLSRPILAVSSMWGQVLTFRFIDRFGKGIRGAPRDAIIAESTPSKDLGRAFGLHRGMDTLGAVAGPLIAFIVLYFFTGNFRMVFWLSLIPGFIAVAVIIFFVKETKHKETSLKPKLSLKDFDWRYKAFVAVSALFALGNSSDAFLILRATDTGISETHVPLLYLSFNLIYSLVSFPAGVLSDRIGRKRVILSGFILFGFVYLGFALASATWHIWGLFLLYGIFMGLTEGIHKAYLGSIIPEHLKATGFGIYNTCVGLAVLPASIIGGRLWDTFGAHATFYYGSITAFMAAILFLIIFGREEFKRSRQ